MEPRLILETRSAASPELRVEGRRLIGVPMRFGEIAPTYRERFAPQAFEWDGSVVLDLEHRNLEAVAWHPDGGLSLVQDDDTLTMTAELPPIPAAHKALEMIGRKEIRGLSVQFHALEQAREDGIRVIKRARLSGIGLVRDPAYRGTSVELRSGRRRVWL